MWPRRSSFKPNCSLSGSKDSESAQKLQQTSSNRRSLYRGKTTEGQRQDFYVKAIARIVIGLVSRNDGKTEQEQCPMSTELWNILKAIQGSLLSGDYAAAIGESFKGSKSEITVAQWTTKVEEVNSQGTRPTDVALQLHWVYFWEIIGITGVTLERGTHSCVGTHMGVMHIAFRLRVWWSDGWRRIVESLHWTLKQRSPLLG